MANLEWHFWEFACCFYCFLCKPALIDSWTINTYLCYYIFYFIYTYLLCRFEQIKDYNFFERSKDLNHDNFRTYYVPSIHGNCCCNWQNKNLDAGIVWPNLEEDGGSMVVVMAKETDIRPVFVVINSTVSNTRLRSWNFMLHSMICG